MWEVCSGCQRAVCVVVVGLRLRCFDAVGFGCSFGCGLTGTGAEKPWGLRRASRVRDHAWEMWGGGCACHSLIRAP